MRSSPLALLFAVFCTGCSTLATGPSWTGGGLATIAPSRAAEREEELTREAKRVAAEPRKVGAKHAVVMHKDSAGKHEITRSRAEARARAEECLKRIRSGEDFDKVVGIYSDEPGAAERAGDLGTFGRGAMVKPFSDAVFGMKVGEVSEVVETIFGFHVIKRTS